MKKKTLLFILTGVLLISLSFFFVALKLSSNAISEPGNKTDYGFGKMGNDKNFTDLDIDNLPANCWELDSGKIVCRVASNIKIDSGEIIEEDFKIKIFKG